MITFNNVSKYYDGDKEALVDVSFDIQQGEMVFLTGHSGAGKSTILKLIPKIESCSKGQVYINRKNVSALSRSKVAYLRRNIGLIFQDAQLLKNRTVYENVALPLMINGVPHREISRRVRAALEKVELLSKEKNMSTSLSSGEQQRVGIARAIVNKPKVLLADEPTGNLDPDLSIEIFKLFQMFNQVGVTILIATHDTSLISHFKHRKITLAHGQIISDGTYG